MISLSYQRVITYKLTAEDCVVLILNSSGEN